MTTKEEEQPLVSVVVLSYRSSATIEATLDSIWRQTYRNVELIVTDDGSADDSVQRSKAWIAGHGSRFAGAQVITTPVNTGISANANRGCRAARGRWLKLLAADDQLTDDAIAQLMQHASLHPEQQVIFAKVLPFGDLKAARRWTWFNPKMYFTHFSRRDFTTRLFAGNFLPAAAAIIRADCYEALGGFEESIPLMEDWPFWIKMACSDAPFGFLDAYTARYRFSTASVSQTNDEKTTLPELYLNTHRIAEQFALNKMRTHAFLQWLLKTAGKKHAQGGSPLWEVVYAVRSLNPAYSYMKRYRKLNNEVFRLHLALNEEELKLHACDAT